jgi:hypothetical protein
MELGQNWGHSNCCGQWREKQAWTVKLLLCKMSRRYEQGLCHFGGTVSMDTGPALIGSDMRCME